MSAQGVCNRQGFGIWTHTYTKRNSEGPTNTLYWIGWTDGKVNIGETWVVNFQQLKSKSDKPIPKINPKPEPTLFGSTTSCIKILLEDAARVQKLYMVLPKSPLREPKDMLETPPERAFSKTPAKAGSTLSFSDPGGSNPRDSKSFAKLPNSLFTICRVADIKDLQGFEYLATHHPVL